MKRLRSLFDSPNRELDRAVKLGDAETVRKALAEGANKEWRSKAGETPLHWAALGGYATVVQVLIEEGADKEAKTNGGLTPLHYVGAGAPVKGKVKDGLERHGKGVIAQAWAAIMDHTPAAAVATVLIRSRAEINARNSDGLRPLRKAAGRGHGAVVEVLANAGADIEEKEREGNTPLHTAAMLGYASVADGLVRSGAELNPQDEDGSTPLHWACFGSFLCLSQGGDISALRGHSSVAEILVRAGANLTAKDNKGKTPLGVAAPFLIETVAGCAAVVQVLRNAGAPG